jgi:hypothetical protein
MSVLLLLSASTIIGQGISEQLCNGIGVSIVQALKPTKIYRQDIFKNDCDFEFDVSVSENVYIGIEKYKTKSESHKALKSDLRSFLAYNDLGEKPKFSRAKVNAAFYWDEAFFYKSSFKDNFILLRKRNHNIVLISSNADILTELEMKFRKIKL